MKEEKKGIQGMEEGRKVAENRHINHTRKYMRHSACNCYAEDVELTLSGKQPEPVIAVEG